MFSTLSAENPPKFTQSSSFIHSLARGFQQRPIFKPTNRLEQHSRHVKSFKIESTAGINPVVNLCAGKKLTEIFRPKWIRLKVDMQMRVFLNYAIAKYFVKCKFCAWSGQTSNKSHPTPNGIQFHREFIINLEIFFVSHSAVLIKFIKFNWKQPWLVWSDDESFMNIFSKAF